MQKDENLRDLKSAYRITVFTKIPLYDMNGRLYIV